MFDADPYIDHLAEQVAQAVARGREAQKRPPPSTATITLPNGTTITTTTDRIGEVMQALQDLPARPLKFTCTL